jgi:hypothetical protein
MHNALEKKKTTYFPGQIYTQNKKEINSVPEIWMANLIWNDKFIAPKRWETKITGFRNLVNFLFNAKTLYGMTHLLLQRDEIMRIKENYFQQVFVIGNFLLNAKENEKVVF